MHPQEVHAPPRSFGEFVRAYAMIVLSILTALALEQGVVTWEAGQRAAASGARITAELRANADELRRAIAANTAAFEAGQALGRDLTAELAKPAPDQAAVQKQLQARLGHTLALILPTWRHDAWDAAIADQSVGHLPHEALHRFAEAYAAGRDSADSSHLVVGGELLDRVARVQLDVRLGHADAREAALLVSRYLLSVELILHNQQELAALLSGAGGASAGVPSSDK